MSFILSIAAIFNSVARLLVGYLIQKISFKVLYISVVCMQIATSFTINLFTSGNYVVFVIYLSMAMFSIGAHVTLFPTLTTSVFGIDAGKAIYPFVYQCFSAASLVQTFLFMYLNSADGDKDFYKILFIIFGCLSILALVVAIFFKESWDWTKANIKYNEMIESELVKKKKSLNENMETED